MDGAKMATSYPKKRTSWMLQRKTRVDLSHVGSVLLNFTGGNFQNGILFDGMIWWFSGYVDGNERFFERKEGLAFGAEFWSCRGVDGEWMASEAPEKFHFTI